VRRSPAPAAGQKCHRHFVLGLAAWRVDAIGAERSLQDVTSYSCLNADFTDNPPYDVDNQQDIKDPKDLRSAVVAP